MTGTIDVRINSDHPDKPLDRHYVFVGSPDAPRIVNVPSEIGDWEITEVYVSTSLPDGTMHSAQATLVEDTYVATLPKCDVVGVVEGGFQIVCNGTDETGEAFEGLCLGVGDLEVLPRNGQIHVGETVHFFRIVDTVPATPQRGDACVIDGRWKWYDGTEWLPFGGGAPVEIDTTLSHSGQAADAKATGDSIKAKRSLTDETAYDALARWVAKAPGMSNDVIFEMDEQPLPGYSSSYTHANEMHIAFKEDEGNVYGVQGIWPNVNASAPVAALDMSGVTFSVTLPGWSTLQFISRENYGQSQTHKMARRAVGAANALAKFDAQGNLVADTSATERVATIDDKADKFTEWDIIGSDKPGGHLELRYFDEIREWHLLVDDQYYAYSIGNEGSIRLSDFDRGGEALDLTATRKRVLYSDDISADNTAFAAAVEEIIRRQNNAQ